MDALFLSPPMIKYLIGIIISLVVLTFVRAVWGIIQKAVVDEVKSAISDDPTPNQANSAPDANTTLRKCVACGTYKAESLMRRHGDGDKRIFFCSVECEKKANS